MGDPQGQLLWQAHTRKWNGGGQLFMHLLTILAQSSQYLGRYRAGRNGVDTNPIFYQFSREAARQVFDGGLRDRIQRVLNPHPGADRGAYIDDGGRRSTAQRGKRRLN